MLVSTKIKLENCKEDTKLSAMTIANSSAVKILEGGSSTELISWSFIED